MKKKISIRELENLHFDKIEFSEPDEKQNDPTMLLVRNQPCDNLDFRINALKHEYALIMYDVSEQGTTIFSQKVLSSQPKQLKEHVQLIIAQYISLKDCAEKLNMLLKYFLQLQAIEDI